MQTCGQIVDALEHIRTLGSEHEILLIGDENAQLLIGSVSEVGLRRREDEHTAHSAGTGDDIAEGLHGVIAGVAGVVGVNEEQGIHTPIVPRPTDTFEAGSPRPQPTPPLTCMDTNNLVSILEL